jgi:hypothetical protein
MALSHTPEMGKSMFCEFYSNKVVIFKKQNIKLPHRMRIKKSENGKGVSN